MNSILADNVVTLTVSQQVLLWLAVGVLGLMGFRRGLNREVVSLLGVGLGVFFSGTLAGLVGPVVGRVYALAQSILPGGEGDPGGALQVKALQGLLGGSGQGESLALVIFALLALGFYVYAEWRVPAPRFILGNVLGMGTGAVKGLLLAYYLFPLLLPKPASVGAMSVGSMGATSNSAETLALMGVLLIAVLIAFGLYNAARSDDMEPPSPGAAKR